jgi:uncharacterized protein (TIGR02246 family)
MLKQLFVAFLIAGCALSAAPASAQEDEIRAAMARWSEVYATATDASEMLALYHPDATFWGTGARTPMVGAAEFAPYFQNQFDNLADRAHAFLDPVIRFYGDDGNVATAIGLYRFNVTPSNGVPVEVTYRFTFDYVRTEEGWLVIQQHSSQIP